MDKNGSELYDEFYKKIPCNSVGDVYHNLAVELKIMFTLPVTTTTAKR